MKYIISKLQNFTARAKYPSRVNRPHSSPRCIVCNRRGAESKASVASKHIINAVFQVFVMVAWCERWRDIHSEWCSHASRRLQKCSSCLAQKPRTGGGGNKKTSHLQRLSVWGVCKVSKWAQRAEKISENQVQVWMCVMGQSNVHQWLQCWTGSLRFWNPHIWRKNWPPYFKSKYSPHCLLAQKATTRRLDHTIT